MINCLAENIINIDGSGKEESKRIKSIFIGLVSLFNGI